MNYWKRLLMFFFHVIACRTLYAQNKLIDVQHYRFEISLNDSNNIIRGKANYRLQDRSKPPDMVFFDLVAPVDSNGKGMKVSRVSENNKGLKFTQTTTM